MSYERSTVLFIAWVLNSINSEVIHSFGGQEISISIVFL